MKIASESQAIALLNDVQQSALQREAAARYLQQHPDDRGIPRLIEALQDEDEGVRWAAAQGLSKLGGVVLPDLLKALMDPKRVGDPRLRESAYIVLHHLPSLSGRTGPLLRELRAFLVPDIGTMLAAARLYRQLKSNTGFDLLSGPLTRAQAASPAGMTSNSLILRFGANVVCPDGLVGKFKYLVVNPVKLQVTHLVAEESVYPYDIWLLPSSLILRSTPDYIRLCCLRSELAAEERAIHSESAYPHLPYFALSAADYMLSPFLVAGEVESTIHSGGEPFPLDKTTVSQTTQVEAADGYLGRVTRVDVAPQSRHLTTLGCRAGHWWHRHQFSIPVAAIDRMEANQVYLRCTRHAAETYAGLPGETRAH